MTDLLPLDPKRDAEAVLRLHAELSLTARSTFEQFGFDVVERQTVARNGQEFVRFKMQKLIGG
ncbi:GNAT family protein [Sinorhizobium meliloti]|uniref:hypothetical protein n=1 Tax=Rhizobium meliloti TaxID=382 RepID=UPI000FE05FE5|nr:hypothetical protein [Sinorhizobium meliloti]RVL95604.1 hypothetical protein CN136_19465 [Sinorhizobium meliloti]